MIQRNNQKRSVLTLNGETKLLKEEVTDGGTASSTTVSSNGGQTLPKKRKLKSISQTTKNKLECLSRSGPTT